VRFRRGPDRLPLCLRSGGHRSRGALAGGARIYDQVEAQHPTERSSVEGNPCRSARAALGVEASRVVVVLTETAMRLKFRHTATNHLAERRSFEEVRICSFLHRSGAEGSSPLDYAPCPLATKSRPEGHSGRAPPPDDFKGSGLQSTSRPIGVSIFAAEQISAHNQPQLLPHIN
jgi:hypothetical protein